jgi:ABC-type methionine transport system permease subunit
MLSDTVIALLAKGTWETVYMTFVSGFFGFVLGLPVGIFLFLTRKGQFWKMLSITEHYPFWLIFSVPSLSLF